MRTKRAMAVLLLAGVAAACSSGPADDTSSDNLAAVAATPGQKGFYGDDRVGAALKDHPELIPTNFGEYEQLFKVGRACARTDSKEVFVVQESQTRGQTGDEKTAALLPRAVITGCNTGNVRDFPTLRNSYSLMAALISDPRMPHAADGDTMVLTPVEAVALDNTTGEYNF